MLNKTLSVWELAVVSVIEQYHLSVHLPVSSAELLIKFEWEPFHRPMLTSVVLMLGYLLVSFSTFFTYPLTRFYSCRIVSILIKDPFKNYSYSVGPCQNNLKKKNLNTINNYTKM